VRNSIGGPDGWPCPFFLPSLRAVLLQNLELEIPASQSFEVAIEVIGFSEQGVILLFLVYQCPFSGFAGFCKAIVPALQVLVIGVKLVKLILFSIQLTLKVSDFVFKRLYSLSLDEIDKARPYLTNYLLDLLERQAKSSFIMEQMFCISTTWGAFAVMA
jgi:hypothetical protein